MNTSVASQEERMQEGKKKIEQEGIRKDQEIKMGNIL